MGHSQCGGIGALVDGAGSEGAPSYITSWMALMTDVVQRLEAEGGRAWPTAKQRAFCEREALKLSLDNLHTYSWVNERVDSGQLALHAWHYDLVSGGLQGLDPTTGTFVDLVEGTDVVHA
jgi:carbonic anhydrase